MMWSLVVVFLIANVLCRDSVLKSKLVFTEQGPVKGYLNEEKGVFEFYGIPYALAPTKENKFQAPLPPKTRLNTTVIEAINRGIVCQQGVSPNVNLTGKTMREDCLIANIFLPQSEEKNLPVLVYVHGGGFQVGYGTETQFSALVKTHNILVVTFNYRLGIIGNLCLGTDNAPGNAGLKDQVALLRWVNKNIRHFGGDPNKVTLAGCSSGAVSVDILGLSNSTEGLFRNMIVNSGSSLDVFAVQLDPNDNALYYVKKLKLTNAHNSVKYLESVYKSIPTKLLLSDVFDDLTNSILVFSPCVERNDRGSILTKAPLNILKNQDYTKIPVLYTFAQMEGLMKMYMFDRWKNEMKGSFSDYLPGDLKFQNKEEKQILANVVKDFYFKNVSEKNKPISYVKYFTDMMFVYGILKSVELRAQGNQGNVYLLEYSYVNERSTSVPYSSLRGANHCSQILAVSDEEESELTQEYKRVKNIMRQIWANFIKTSEPAPKESSLPQWPAVSTHLGPFMNLGKNLELKTGLDFSSNSSFQFWDNIYKKYYRFPVPPIT